MRYVRVSDKEDSKRFEIILKTGNRVKTCIEIRKRESIVCLAIIGWTAVRRRVIIIERSATILLSISKRIGSRATIPGNPITRNEIYPNFQSIEHRFDYYPPDL